MAGSAHATVDAANRERTRRASAGSGRALWPAAAVATAFTLAQLVLVRPGLGLGWDETVYVSQVSGHAPASFFSAPRARGVSLLVAPVAAWSSSTALLRIYLALLSGLALFLALRAWRGLFPVRVLAFGGALFASLWVTLFYGPQAMPNYWVAVAALAAVACFLRAPADRGALWGLAGSAALMAWMRPVDAVWAAVPLLALGLARRNRRALLVLLAGLAAGAAEWVVEAYTGYGGLARRLSDGSAIQGGLGWHFAVVDQLRALGGRTLCRPCAGALPHPLVTLWWCTLPVLAALALVVARRERRPAATLLPLACAATAAFPYLFLIGYAAPRFLLPAYALLAIPVADALAHLATRPRRAQPGDHRPASGAGGMRPTARPDRHSPRNPARRPDAPPAPHPAGRPAPDPAPHPRPAVSRPRRSTASLDHRPAPRPARRPLALAAVGACLATHLAVQLVVLLHVVGAATAAHDAWGRTAAEMRRRGVRPPCLVTGQEAIPVGFAAGCASAATSGPNTNTTEDGITRTARRTPVATLVPAGSGPPRYARDWPSVPVGAVRLYYVVPGAAS
ncbi:hypothetical protein HKX69_02325 [Streptomyces argyrophyllae]|uniref:DUF2029 domain-containing protein n=1 Tax=Streptomyces argyrophylli TaxID=2726118 RepID=A0A6M4PE87_9ACTN|nr:hypothetical protein [Streptomyces argyrophyllae]QJS08503.1 hypothetical protein HKX69_02325 [Streptomyces argyrophyllae]